MRVKIFKIIIVKIKEEEDHFEHKTEEDNKEITNNNN